MVHLYSKVQTKKSHKIQLDLNSELTRRMKIDHIFEDFSGIELDGERRKLYDSEMALPRNFDCLRTLMNAFEQFYFKMEDYDL